MQKTDNNKRIIVLLLLLLVLVATLTKDRLLQRGIEFADALGNDVITSYLLRLEGKLDDRLYNAAQANDPQLVSKYIRLGADPNILEMIGD